MFQTLGAYLDALALIAVGVVGRQFAPKWVSQEGPDEEVKRRVGRMRKACTVVLIAGLGLLVMRLLGI